MNDNLLTTINNQVARTLGDVSDTVHFVQQFLKDKSFPLEARWELYLKAESLLPVASYGSEAVDILTDSLYDDLYMERYATATYSSIERRVLDNWDGSSEEEPDKYEAKFKSMFEKLDEFREAVLQEGYGGFTNDW